MTVQPDDEDADGYLRYLPAVFQQPGLEEQTSFLARFLLPFEMLFTGMKKVEAPGLEEWLEGIDSQLGGIERYLSPGAAGAGEAFCAPTEFLNWLASWAALALRFDLDPVKQRHLIARIFELYRWRGTEKGLREMLELIFGCGVLIREQRPSFRLGQARVGSKIEEQQTRLGEKSPHFFKVTVFPIRPEAKEKLEAEVYAAIELERPAHATYAVFTDRAAFWVGKAMVGLQTVVRE
jgi:phage tail-like protein